VVAQPEALDRMTPPEDGLILRLAPDDVLITGGGDVAVDDPHALIQDETGFSAMALTEAQILDVLGRCASWEPPAGRPCLAQGMVAGLPVRIWIDHGQGLVIVPTPLAHELEERLR
jgi:hypothetical protein